MKRLSVRLASVFVSLLSGAAAAFAGTIFVDASNCPGPGDGTSGNPFCLIQAAIDAAADGDTVLVAPGTYVERIDFLGKAITVQSSGGAAVTTIDGNHAGSVVTFQSSEGADSVLEGFTITHGSDSGIRGHLSSPTIANNTILFNTSSMGGGGIDLFDGPVTTHHGRSQPRRLLDPSDGDEVRGPGAALEPTGLPHQP